MGYMSPFYDFNHLSLFQLNHYMAFLYLDPTVSLIVSSSAILRESVIFFVVSMMNNYLYQSGKLQSQRLLVVF